MKARTTKPREIIVKRILYIDGKEAAVISTHDHSESIADAERELYEKRMDLDRVIDWIDNPD